MKRLGREHTDRRERIGREANLYNKICGIREETPEVGKETAGKTGTHFY